LAYVVNHFSFGKLFWLIDFNLVSANFCKESYNPDKNCFMTFITDIAQIEMLLFLEWIEWH